MAASPEARAQSRTSPNANAVCACSPSRIGYASFGIQSASLRAAARSSGSSVFAQALASGSSQPRSSAESCRSHARPYGRSNVARPGAERYATSPATFSGVNDALERRAGPRRERGRRERPGEPREQPVPVHGRVPVVAAVEDRRQDARRLRVRVAVHDVRDLVRVLLADAREREVGEPARGLFVERFRSGEGMGRRREKSGRKKPTHGPDANPWAARYPAACVSGTRRAARPRPQAHRTSSRSSSAARRPAPRRARGPRRPTRRSEGDARRRGPREPHVARPRVLPRPDGRLHAPDGSVPLGLREPRRGARAEAITCRRGSRSTTCRRSMRSWFPTIITTIWMTGP